MRLASVALGTLLSRPGLVGDRRRGRVRLPAQLDPAPGWRLLLLDNDHGRVLSIALDPKGERAAVDGEFPTYEDTCLPQGTALETAGGGVLAACWGNFLREYDGETGALVWGAEVECRQPFGTGAVRWYPLDGWE